jgi:rhodanese-related sulfurtransferase
MIIQCIKTKISKISLIFLFLVIVISLPVMSCNTSLDEGFMNKTTAECNTLIQENIDNPDFIILDVRTPAEYAGGHIENAVNLDYYEDDFEATLNTWDKSKTYLIYCRTASRSAAVMKIMQRLEFTDVYNMLGGINAWTNAGLPTVS